MEKRYKRVNITILEAQYRMLLEEGLNVSGLVRDLLGDHLSNSTIQLQVSEETQNVYEHVIANTGATDADLEIHFRAALGTLLDTRIHEMSVLRQKLLEEVKEVI